MGGGQGPQVPGPPPTFFSACICREKVSDVKHLLLKGDLVINAEWGIMLFKKDRLIANFANLRVWRLALGREIIRAVGRGV